MNDLSIIIFLPKMSNFSSTSFHLKGIIFYPPVFSQNAGTFNHQFPPKMSVLITTRFLPNEWSVNHTFLSKIAKLKLNSQDQTQELNWHIENLLISITTRIQNTSNEKVCWILNTTISLFQYVKTVNYFYLNGQARKFRGRSWAVWRVSFLS